MVTKQFLMLSIMVLLVLLLVYIMAKPDSSIARYLRPGKAPVMVPAAQGTGADAATSPGSQNNAATLKDKSKQEISTILDNKKMTENMTVSEESPDYSWDEVIARNELDPGVFENHNAFVKDVRRFSSGANFTSVSDDNTSPFFTNFIGLNRPQHVNIGADARQVPDVDEDVLKRNKFMRWNGVQFANPDAPSTF